MPPLPVIPPLADILDLKELAPGVFMGPVVDDGRTRIYGGQTAAQALAAASFTVDGGTCHSMHSRFLRPGKPGRSLEFEVTALMDTRRFAVRQVMARQRDELVYQLTASFQLGGGASPEFSAMQPELPAPDQLPDEASQHAIVKARVPPAMQPHLLRRWPMEFRFEQDVFWFERQARPPHRKLWMRLRDPLPDYPNMHRCALAYASDFPLFQVCFFPLTASPFSPGMQLASLDHNLWFHRPMIADRWLLFAARCPTVNDGRGMAEGEFFQDGKLVATVTQQTLIHDREA